MKGITPINENTLLSSGFIKIANMYRRGNIWLQLIKGHTWILTHHSLKHSLDVKTIEDVNLKESELKL